MTTQKQTEQDRRFSAIVSYFNNTSQHSTAARAALIELESEHSALCAVAEAAKVVIDEMSDGQGCSLLHGKTLECALQHLATIRKG